MDFERWKNLQPVTSIAKAIAFDTELALSRDWDDYTRRFIAANGDDGSVVKVAREMCAKLSTGEVSVMAAMLHAADYSHVADELTGHGAWHRFRRTRKEHAEAVTLAILRA